MSMFGRVIMVGNLACYNQVQVIIAMKVIVMTNILYMMMQMIMMLNEGTHDGIHAHDEGGDA